MQVNFAKIAPHLVALLVFFATAAFYFSPQFSGKILPQGDIISYKGMSQELTQYEKETGNYSLWTNSMFGGMPAYQIRTVSAGNYVKKLENVARLYIAPPAGQFIAAMVCFYVFMLVAGVNPWLGLVGALAFGFTTNNLILYEAGHETKLRAISYLPLVAAGMLAAFRGRYILGGLLFGIGMGMDLAANHLQMTYYFLLTALIYGVVQLVIHARSGAWMTFGKATAALVLGGLLALGCAASNLLVTAEYAEDTMRGAPILESDGSAPSSSSQTDGLEWNYAMQWSNGTLDLFSSFIPGVVGGGSSEPVDRGSAYAKVMQRLGARTGPDMEAPLYWGSLPFTSGPAYFGAVVVFLFIIGLSLEKSPLKWWLALGTLLTFMLSMGKNMEFVNRLFFDYFPLYNKFRTPNSVLSVTAFLVTALAGLGLYNLTKSDIDAKAKMRALYIALGVSGGLALFFALLGPGFFDFSGEGDASMIARMLGGQDNPEVATLLLNGLQDSRAELMRADAFRTFIFVALAGALCFLFLKGKLKLPVLTAGLAILVVVDLTGVGMRYLKAKDFQPARSYAANFEKRPVDEQILQDKGYYRVHDITVNSFNSAIPSYHHKMVGGYHAAKLQRYQDLIDYYLAPQGKAPAQGVFNMLNTKYFIVPGAEGQPQVQLNPGALGNAWVVDSIAFATSNREEIEGLEKVDLARAAVVHNAFKDYLNGLQQGTAGQVTLQSYAPDKLTYSAQMDKEGLVVFSEIWYGPDKGWQAYIDGQPAEHIRANYLLRAMRIPAGKHEVVFEFKPQRFAQGKAISSASSLVLLLGFLGYLAWQWKQSSATTVAAPVDNEPALAKSKPKKKG